MLTGNAKILTDHINQTASIKQRLLRAPRTHDGFLMRSGNYDHKLLYKLANEVRAVSGLVK